jgi:hypothetical protein
MGSFMTDNHGILPAKNGQPMNSPQQIQLNEIFAGESIMERGVANVKSIA